MHVTKVTFVKCCQLAAGACAGDFCSRALVNCGNGFAHCQNQGWEGQRRQKKAYKPKRLAGDVKEGKAKRFPVAKRELHPKLARVSLG